MHHNENKKVSMKLKGEVGFQQFYESHWGERWPQLLAALKCEVQKYELKNPFASEYLELTKVYELDPASMQVAQALNAAPGSKILDMCAAPGGKSLAKIFELRGQANWVLNDVSEDRVHRLRRVVKEYVPENLRSHIHITKRDASRWGLYEPSTYDCVLLDAPCSGERHMLLNKTEMAHWSVKRSKGLKQRQYALLCAAAQTVKPGGQIVYATCSISPLENDEVIARFLERKPGQLVVENISSELGESTQFGRQILPDKCAGQGPMYYASLRRTEV
jgi:16S rRNA C967 or C1407 C5-methylase (RsmB/RsmF family)